MKSLFFTILGFFTGNIITQYFINETINMIEVIGVTLLTAIIYISFNYMYQRCKMKRFIKK